MNLTKVTLEKREYIENSIQFIKYDIDKHVMNLVKYRNTVSIDDKELLSENISKNKVSPELKQSAQSLENNLKLYLYTAASELEKTNYPNYEAFINEMDKSRKSKDVYIYFVKSLKELSYSLKVLDLLFYIGKFVNNIITARAKEGNYEYTLLSDLKVNSQNIANCFFIYELASFLSKSLEDFQLLGIQSVQNTIAEHLQKISNSKEENKHKVHVAKGDKTLDKLKTSEQLLLELEVKFTAINQNIIEAKNFSEKIEHIKNDAKIQINTLDAITFTSFLDDNFGTFGNFSFLEEFDMPDIALEDLPKLLGDG